MKIRNNSRILALVLALVAVNVPTHADIVVGVAVNVFVLFAATLPLVALIANVGVYLFIVIALVQLKLPAL